MLVVDLLRSTQRWDKKALLLVQKELTAIALQDNRMRLPLMREMALSKLKDQSERFTIADEVLRLVAVEKEKAKPPVVFHNGCLLL